MTPTNDYQGCLQALATAVSLSVVATQMACRPNSKTKAEGLVEEMRGHYNHYVKPLFGKKADEAVEHEIGAAFGALVTNLQAIHASWLVFATSNNKHIELEPLSQAFSLQAVQAGQACNSKGVDAVAQLLKDEGVLGCKGATFVEMVNAYVKSADLLYDPHFYPYKEGRHGYGILGIYVAERNRKRLRFEFTYWDGCDAIMVPMGEMFRMPEQVAHVERLAQQVFGPGVKFSIKHSVVELCC
jgi:hypothetical protein